MLRRYAFTGSEPNELKVYNQRIANKDPNKPIEEVLTYELFPWPDVLILLDKNDGGFYIDRYTSSAEPCSDSWSMTIEEAYKHAEFEFDLKKEDWKDIPGDVEDEVEHALAKYNEIIKNQK